jgi:hypothetical protein
MAWFSAKLPGNCEDIIFQQLRKQSGPPGHDWFGPKLPFTLLFFFVKPGHDWFGPKLPFTLLFFFVLTGLGLTVFD